MLFIIPAVLKSHFFQPLPLLTLSFTLLITSPCSLPASYHHLIFLHLSFGLPLCILSGCLIKGALSNEITPWGLMVWLIDRHTAGEDLIPLSPQWVFWHFS